MKITKAFLDAVYAFLDGLVLLASEEVPKSVTVGLGLGATGVGTTTAEMLPGAGNGAVAGVVGSRVELIDLSKPVSVFYYLPSSLPSLLPTLSL